MGNVLLGVFVHLAIAARRTALGGVAAAAAALAFVQVGLGIAAVLSGLAVPLRATHAVVAYLLWATLVWISVRTGRWSAVVADETRAASPHLTGVARAS